MQRGIKGDFELMTLNKLLNEASFIGGLLYCARVAIYVVSKAIDFLKRP